MSVEAGIAKPQEPALRTEHGELVLLIAEQTRRVPVARYLSSAAIAGLLLLYEKPLWPLAWFAMTVAVLAYRTHVLRRLPADTTLTDEQKLTRIAQVFALSGLAQITQVAFVPHVPVIMFAVISIFAVGLTAGTLHATAGYRKIYLPYLACVMIPIGLAWGLLPDSSVAERIFFLTLVVLFSTTMVSHSRGAYGVFAESYRIRLQRLELLRQLEEALAGAESANRAKTRFLAAASHDLRQPIHALSLFSGSLLQRALDPRAGAIADQIDRAVRTLATQMDALLDVSRLDAGVIERSLAPVDLRAMLDQLADEFQPQAAGKGLALQVDCPAQATLLTDALLFLRVLRNLLSNAVKYTEAGRIDVHVVLDGGRCRIDVRDTGPGIPASEHERIFEEFYQLQNPERDRTKGLGLGLAIVRRLTDLLDIGLALDSAPGRGTCFSLTVPLAQGAPAPRRPDEAVAGGAPRRIGVLVIDDEEAIRLGMRALLEDMGFDVRTAASTEEAVRAAREAPPMIVLADLRLRQDDDGMRAIRELRRVCPGLPALLISGETAPDRLREARDAGIPLLHKPVPPAVLRDSIVRVATA